MKYVRICLACIALGALATRSVLASAQEETRARGPEVVEITRPAAVQLVGTAYLGRIVSARRAPQLTSVEQQTSLEQLIGHLQKGELQDAEEAWVVCAANLPEASALPEVEHFVLYILNQSFLQPSPGLLVHAEKVRFFNEQKDVVQEYIRWLRQHPSVDIESEIADTTIENLVLAPYVPGGTVVRSREPELVLRKDLAQRIEEWERTLDTIRQDADLADSELRAAMLKERPVVQAITASSKMLHEVSERIGQESLRGG